VSRRHPILTSDILAAVPRVDVVSVEMGRKIVLFTRGYRCRPDFFVDGVRNEGEVDVDRINPAEIAGIEIYPGLTAPVQYRRSPCGALLIWTRRDASVAVPSAAGTPACGMGTFHPPASGPCLGAGVSLRHQEFPIIQCGS
jgi:hypothetical protein